MKRETQLPRLLALSPGNVDVQRPGRFLEALDSALEAGLLGLMLREPRLGDGAYLELARLVRARLARSAGPCWFAVHDRAHLALDLAADAVHLSFRSLRAEELRPWTGERLAIGLSSHAADAPESWQGADYLVHGPLRSTPSKEGRLAPIGFAGLRAAVAAAPCPILALGGVRPEDVAPALQAGAWGVAVLSGILLAEDPRAATRAYLEALAALRE